MNDLINHNKFFLKLILFPGLDLHTRSRYRFLPHFFRHGLIDTLDAGCGNGALSYAAYKLGNRVLGASISPEDIRRAQIFFEHRGVDSARLKFKTLNLYDLPKLSRKFDQIICSETLEHIKDDCAIIKIFYDIMRPGGILHLCAPFALHPDHCLARRDNPEDGGHVRDGYTMASYKELLKQSGFKIMASAGLGPPLLVNIDKFIRLIRNRLGDIAALPFFMATYPLQLLDHLDPALPYSLYIQAVKSA